MENTAGASSFSAGVYTTPTLDATSSSGTSPASVETLNAATTLPRLKVPLRGVASDGIAVRIANNGTDMSTDFRVFMIEAEVQPREQSH
jgi:hypothetical protein